MISELGSSRTVVCRVCFKIEGLAFESETYYL